MKLSKLGKNSPNQSTAFDHRKIIGKQMMKITKNGSNTKNDHFLTKSGILIG